MNEEKGKGNVTKVEEKELKKNGREIPKERKKV